VKIWICIFLIGGIGMQLSIAQSRQVENVLLEWASANFNETQDSTFKKLTFEGAVYGDSLDAIPVFLHRAKSSDPGFVNQFQVSNTRFERVQPQERQLLIDAGFSQTQLQLSNQKEINRRELYSVVTFYPFRFNAALNDFEKLVSFDLISTQVPLPKNALSAMHQYPVASVLATGTWFRICVTETGIHQLTFADLTELGVNTQGLQRENIRIFGNGGGMLPEANNVSRITDLKENPIFIPGAQTGAFTSTDVVLFYGESPMQWNFNANTKAFEHQVHLYATESCYFLTIDNGTGKRITQQPNLSAPANQTATTFHDYAVHHRDMVNLINSGREWYGELFDVTLSRNFVFRFDDLVLNQPGRIRSNVAARSSNMSSFAITVGSARFNQSISQIFPAHVTGAFANPSEVAMPFNPTDGNQVEVNLTYNRTASGAQGWLNFLEVNVVRQLRFRGPQMGFRNTAVIGAGNITQFVISHANAGLTVWDVTDRFNVRVQETLLEGSELRFRQSTNQLRNFIVFDGSTFLRPIRRGRVPNQNLHGMRVADLFIVVHETLKPEAKRLAEFRSQNDNLSVAVVTTTQIYNEFSSGMPDPAAIRNFMKMFYDRATTTAELPRYLLLFGNGTLDNRDILRFGGNLIPTFQSQNSLQFDRTFMTDDFFGLLDDSEGINADGTLDIGIGRFPVRTISEARDVVNKKIRYQQRSPASINSPNTFVPSNLVETFADWRNRVLFVADDQDFNRHFIDSEVLANRMENIFPNFNVQKLYLDAFQQVTMPGGARFPEVNIALNRAINQGALLINYIGHGGFAGLAHERILTFTDIASWNNMHNLPVFMTATCEFSSFDHPNPSDVTAGVRIFLKPTGGAIALFTTTRLAWSGPNMVLNRNFMDVAFERNSQGENFRLGDIIRHAKVRSSGQLENWRIRNFVLLGDPSMLMAYPRNQVRVESITDTIRAFQNVTVSGYITDRAGQRLQNYQGYLFPTVFDKRSNYRTLANDSDSFIADFSVWDAIIFRGKTKVVDGQFSFSFNVPANINYRFGRGRMSFYADDGINDAHGHFQDFIIGGSYTSAAIDDNGPEIRLFLNDTTFVSGGTTNQNPVLLALLRDSSGINITGRIGHDMVAFLNNKTGEPIILNDFFKNNLDDFTQGRIVYPLGNLPAGVNTLTLRAWDTHNNPTQSTIEFYVSHSAILALENLLNYPNPFTQETFFRFSHNMPFTDLDTRIQIFDMSGKLVQEIRTTINSPGFASTPVRWDGKDLQGRLLGNGVYIYRLLVTTPEGHQSTKSQRLVVIR